MGVVISYVFGDTGRTDDPDPVTGLTSRDRYIIKTSWKKITSGSGNLETGIAVFLNLFEKSPEFQQLFVFRDIPRDQLKDNNKFKAHCIGVMYALSSIVESIDTPLVVEQLLAKQGVNHVPRKVPDYGQLQLKEVLLELFAKSLNEVEVKTWKKFLDLGFQIILTNAEETRKN